MSSMELTEFDLNNIFTSGITSVPTPASAPPRMSANNSLLATGTFDFLTSSNNQSRSQVYPLFSHPHTDHTHRPRRYGSTPLPAPDPTPAPQTPSIKPSPALDTSPVTPGVTATACIPPAPLSLPTAASELAPSVLAKPHPQPQRSLPPSLPQVPSKFAPGKNNNSSVNALLKWVTREPVVISGSYRPGNSVQEAFNAVRAGVPNSLDAAMTELHRDVRRYVDGKKDMKRNVHKQRLKTVAGELSMELREIARHRIEASLTKFKKQENEKAQHAAMRWLGEQLQASYVQEH